MASHWRCSRSSRCEHHSARLTGALRQPLGMEAQAHHVEGMAEQPLRHAVEQRRHHATVRRHQVPVPVDSQRRIGLVRLQNQIDRLACRLRAGSSSERCGNAGAKPAATSMTLAPLMARRAAPPAAAPCHADGVDRPVSMKLKCRAEISASEARSS